jgi:predicted transcriptional regulator
MRNLLGRLNARSPEDLSEIADAWQTPLVGRDRLSQISQLYRAMTRPPMVRAQWDAISQADRTMVIALLNVGEDGATIQELSERLGLHEDDVRRAALRLYAQGIVAYEGTSATLTIGESPRLYIPTELGQTIHQILDEAREGDISQRPLQDLMGLRTESEIFEAAALWGIEYIPGITTRAEVERSLIRRITATNTRTEHIGKLGHDVRLMWERLSAVPEGTPVALDQVLGTGNDRTLFNRRSAINELENHLLAWSMVSDDGIRALVVPIDLGNVQPSAASGAPRPKPISVVGHVAPFRPESPVAWDLLVVLQRLFGPLATPNLDPLALGPEDAASINGMTWNRGSERPPVGYIEFLIDLAVNLKLLDEPQDGASQFERTAEIREWRTRTWDEQSSRIRRIWMASPYWIDGQGRTDIEPWNVDWRGFRIKLLNHMATLETDTWYRSIDVAEWIVAYDPGILGAGASIGMNHAAGGDTRSEHVRALSHMIDSLLNRVLYWMGLVHVVSPPDGTPLLTVSGSVRDIVRAEAARTPASRAGSSTVSIADDLTIRLANPDPIQVWSVLAFADTVSLGSESVFRITAERVRLAQAAGFRAEQIVQYLRRQNPNIAPADLDQRIDELSRHAQGIEITTALVIDGGSEAARRDMQGLLESNGYVLTVSGGRLVVTVGTLRPIRTDTERVHALLESAGFGPVANRSRT